MELRRTVAASLLRKHTDPDNRSSEKQKQQERILVLGRFSQLVGDLVARLVRFLIEPVGFPVAAPVCTVVLHRLTDHVGPVLFSGESGRSSICWTRRAFEELPEIREARWGSHRTCLFIKPELGGRPARRSLPQRRLLLALPSLSCV